ncbi:NAD-dependent epimerase/dehydratase family protein [Chromatocurvus halotolerans]|uniref:NAD-dependent epimerase/dehydratase family protein n=1 Tax=Chromatocurvus halotolerans TaxID=1132028 RepID=UPI002436BED3|nr:NAD-dependent epimerase/dehydratase family protein [Chromatocurvus halotolerans]
MTGGTGFIGQAIARALRERGHAVRALVRQPAAAGALDALGCERVPGSLEDRDALAQLTDGADSVIHCAGVVRGGRYAHFHQGNVNGSVNLFERLAAASHPPRVIFFSSLAAREPQLSWYARSKFAAEQALLNTAPAQVPFDWTVLRPPAVYGPGDREMLPLFRLMAQRGIAPLPGSAQARVSLLHIDDLVAATLAILDSPHGSGRTLTLHDGKADGYSWQEIADTASQAWGRPVTLRPVPPLLLNLVASNNLRLARLTGRAPMLTPSKLRELRHDNWVCDNAAIQSVCDWQPRIGLAAGLASLTGAVA